MNKNNILMKITLIVILGVCICLIFLNLEKLKKAERKEVENNEIVEDNKIAENNGINGWRDYKGPEFDDLEFQYPENWGELLYEGQIARGGIYHFPQYQEIKKIWYHEPSNSLAFIERGEKCFTFGGVETYEETLKVIKSSKEVKTIIGPAKTPGGHCKYIESVNFSPDGKYIYFGISGYEAWIPMIMDVESGLNIIENYDIWFTIDTIYKNIIWSPDNKVLVIGNEYSSFGGEGSNAIFVSNYNKPEELTKITFPFGWGEEFSDYYKFDNLNFVNNNTLHFSLFFSKDGSFCTGCAKEIKAKYEYNLQTKELNKTF